MLKVQNCAIALRTAEINEVVHVEVEKADKYKIYSASKRMSTPSERITEQKNVVENGETGVQSMHKCRCLRKGYPKIP